MFVLRIEKPETHEGPFRDLGRIYVLEDIGFPCPEGLPIPPDEGAPPDWLCYVDGCKDWDQFKLWFSDEQIKWLQDKGFEVCCYEVPDEHVVILPHQCLFCLNYAKPVPLEEYNARIK